MFLTEKRLLKEGGFLIEESSEQGGHLCIIDFALKEM